VRAVLRAVKDWFGTALFLLAFAGIMVGFDLVIRIACLLGPRANNYALGAIQVALVYALKLCGIRIDVEKSPRVKPHTSYIVVSNHQSMFDIPLFGWQLFTNFPKYIAKIELSRWVPSVSVELRKGGHALIDRRDRDSAVKAIHKLAAQVARGEGSAVIYPEGTRARHGVLGEFKPRGTVALLEQAPTTPIVPVCIDNSWRILENKMLPVPWGIRLRCWIGDPIERRPDEDPYAVAADIERRIRGTMARFRGETSSEQVRPTSASPDEGIARHPTEA
jgi:1-acyl-sn-glycerol-3-phosphate acyltransferase